MKTGDVNAITFIGCFAGTIYVLLGYPLLLLMLTHVWPRPLRRGEPDATVTVIIPARNGARWLAAKLDSVLAQDYPRDLFDVIVVSDGSSDMTESIARQYEGRGVRLIALPAGGKPAALNASVPGAKGELILLTDVRQQLEPDCMRKLAACMTDPAVGAVSGDLRIRGIGDVEQQSTGIYWRYESAIRRALSRVDSLLGATGPIYMIRRRLFSPIPAESLLDDVWLPMSIHLKGYRSVLEESAVAWDEPTDLAMEFRRKVRTQAGMLQFIATFPGLFGRRNRMRFHFLSLKVGRLLLPYFLAGTFVSAIFLRVPWSFVMTVPQLLLWGAALVDPLIPPRANIKRLTTPARAFAVLIFSALAALRIIVTPPGRLWVETRTASSARTTA